MAKPTPFKISASGELLAWIDERIKTTRIPPGKDLPDDNKWSYGLPSSVAHDLHAYWKTKYSWRDVEKRLNADMQMFTLPISEGDEELTIHFVHHRSSSPKAIPLLFEHGWPGSFLEVQPILKELTNPTDEGKQAYHVVAPSLPGFGFSSYPKKPFNPVQMASVVHKVMLALGYDKYVAQGGDWGSMVLRLVALHYPDHCRGLHLNMIFAGPPALTRQPINLARVIFSYATGLWAANEKERIARFQWWRDEESGYIGIQGTKPQTLQYALADSPFGMVCWLYDKMNKLIDEKTGFKWTHETIITWAMIYILNGSPGHAEIYKYAQGEGQKWLLKEMLDKVIDARVAVGVSHFPKDPCYCPRWWAEGNVAHNITVWKEYDEGGHFPTLERPDVLCDDIRALTKTVKW